MSHLMKGVRHALLVAAVLVATALPALSMEVRVGVPPGAISVTVVTVVVFANGNSISNTQSYCPAGNQIYVNLPDGGLDSASAAAGTFFDAYGNEMSNFTVNPGDFVYDDQLYAA